MTSKFSIDNRELLQRISSGDAVVGIDFGNLIVRELAAFRLAAMDSEPVAHISDHDIDAIVWTKYGLERMDLLEGAPLFAVPQPEPVVPDEKPIPNTLSMYAVDAVAAIAKVKGWNACRAAMLATAPHDTHALNSVQSVDSVADRWIPVSERMPENDVSVLTFDGMYKRVDHAMYGHWQCWEPEKITHWMPLPAGPQKVKCE
ncbi:DUF551 domain-containing protein [Klebsiella pneumoniae]